MKEEILLTMFEEIKESQKRLEEKLFKSSLNNNCAVNLNISDDVNKIKQSESEFSHILSQLQVQNKSYKEYNQVFMTQINELTRLGAKPYFLYHSHGVKKSLMVIIVLFILILFLFVGLNMAYLYDWDYKDMINHLILVILAISMTAMLLYIYKLIEQNRNLKNTDLKFRYLSASDEIDKKRLLWVSDYVDNHVDLTDIEDFIIANERNIKRRSDDIKLAEKKERLANLLNFEAKKLKS